MESVLRYGLIAVFLALILTPFGLPIPEDISLLAAGVLVHTGHAHLLAALAVGYVGVLCGDLTAYTFGRRVGIEPTGFISRLVGHDDIQRIERFYHRFGAWAIVIARQFPGMRLPAFFFAGASGVRVRRFLVFDGSAALITVGLYVTLGNLFGDNLGRILEWLDRARLVGTAAGVGFVGFVLWRVIRARRRRKRNARS